MSLKLLADAKLPALEGVGKLGEFTKTLNTGDSTAFSLFINVFSTGIGVLTISAGIWFIIQILSGALKWMASGGEKQALQNAHKHITNAIIGLFVVIFSYGLISIVGLIFGFNILCPFGAIFSNNLGNTSINCNVNTGPIVPNQFNNRR